jgi:ribosomal protein S18 acetylase RimI-like enzyme
VTRQVDFTIRVCTPSDAATVAALGARLFRETYAPTHPEPELSRYLARSFDAGFFATELGDPRVRVLIVDAEDGTAAGYAHLRAMSAPPPPGVIGERPMEIVRFYIDARFHGAGLAQALMSACEAEARRMGADVLWLSAWQEAPRPQAFYRRAGFAIVGTTTFAFGDRRDADYVMARRLLPTVTS